MRTSPASRLSPSRGRMAAGGGSPPAGPVEITTPADLGAWTQGAALSDVAIEATGGTAPRTFARTAGAWPAGVTLNSDGTLTGTPTAAGDFTATVVATDSLMEESEPVVFTGTVTGAALTGDLATGLVGFRFSDYNPATGTWTSYNDGTMLLEQGTESARPALDGEEVVFAGDDVLAGNAAVRGHIAGKADVSIIIVADGTGTGTEQPLVWPAASSTDRTQFYYDGGAARQAPEVLDRRNNDPSDARGTAANSMNYGVSRLVAVISRRADTAKIFVNGNWVEGTDATADQDTAAYSQLGVGGRIDSAVFFTGSIRCVLLWGRELADSDVTAIRAWLSNNAFYGCTGLTL